VGPLAGVGPPHELIAELLVDEDELDGVALEGGDR